MNHKRIFNNISCAILFAIVLFLLSCSTQQKTKQSANNNLYQKNETELKANYLVYHINDSISQLFYTVSNDVLLYKKRDSSQFFFSDLKIELIISTTDNQVVQNDTAFKTIYDKQKEAVVSQLNGNFYFRLKHGKNYNLKINAIDYNKNTFYTQHVYIDKSTNQSRQNFLITNTFNEVQFYSYFKPGERIFIESVRNNATKFDIDYFNSNFKIALPPFTNNTISKFSYTPDSSFILQQTNNKFEITLPQKGFYHLKTNTETKDGVSLFVYETTFPKIKNEMQMILATRYIMAKKEFENCLNNPNKKAGIDHFWLEIAGNNDRARELIRKYYTRVQGANELFTSYQEGWKTDRGMIYTVFGAPTKVLKQQNRETWIYGDLSNPTSVQFNFIKIINPFTDNDFKLERDEVYKERWYQAVDMWRQGKIYLDR